MHGVELQRWTAVALIVSRSLAEEPAAMVGFLQQLAELNKPRADREIKVRERPHLRACNLDQQT